MMTISPSMWLVVLMGTACALWPEEAFLVVEKIRLELAIMSLNFRLRRMQLRLYKQLCKDAKEIGLPAPPPFKFVPIQERGK